MLVLLTFCALISRASPSSYTVPGEIVQNLDRKACALVLCEPAEKGLPGRDGKDGVQGAKGEKGEPGAAGRVGERGPRGEMGIPGERGRQGEPGEKGNAGVAGPPGRAGATGAPGIAGAPGLKGSTGPKGEKGDKGDIGAVGPPGQRGGIGAPGIAGERGEKGPEGERGEKGDQGPRGSPGVQGARGMAGPPGQAGSKGDKGSVGEKGSKGDSGLSEVNLVEEKVSALERQLKTLNANFAKYQKVAAFPGGRVVGNKVFVTSGYEGNFEDLKLRCQQAGAQLASPRNADENRAIQQIAVLYKKSVFLGITDIQSEGKFKYLSGNPIIYSNWQQGEPNNQTGNEDCVEVYVNGKWNDRSCAEKRLMVCEF